MELLGIVLSSITKDYGDMMEKRGNNLGEWITYFENSIFTSRLDRK